jgi:hypothetical protein
MWESAAKWTPATCRRSGPSAVLTAFCAMPRGIAVDVKNKNMFISDKRLNAVLTFHFPEMF